MKAERALCISSGMTALDIITRLVKTKEEIIAGNGNRKLIKISMEERIVFYRIYRNKIILLFIMLMLQTLRKFPKY
jgi:hypothetical protein